MLDAGLTLLNSGYHLPMGEKSSDQVTRKVGKEIERPSLLLAGIFDEGALIANRYRVLRFIARGGIGEVYEVEDQELGGRLALKTLQAGVARDEEARERFRREIQLARRVTHRNVCRIYEAGTDEGIGHLPQLFLTMELLRGPTLEDRIKTSGPLSPEEAIPIVRQMVAGLDAAHGEGVVHRDFKTNNVMLEPPTSGAHAGVGRVVITDFGLARVIEGDDQAVFRTVDTSGISGTIAFMAPEQLRDEALTPATDVYALGVVLFQMMTGRVPFSTQSSIGSLMQLLQEDAPSPRGFAPHLSQQWDAVILKCLEKRPEDRFSTASEVTAALEGQRRILIPSQVRRRWLWAGSVTVLALVLSLMGWWWSDRSDAPRPIHAGDPLQLTADPGLEIDPHFSPDGSMMAYAADRGGGFEIYTRSLEAGARDIRVTDDGRRNVQPVWSPDGERLAYVAQEQGGIWSTSLVGDASKPQRLTDFGSRPTWSPDGQWIAFQGDSRKEISERTLAALPPSTLWRVPVEGGPPERLTQIGEPVGGHGEPAWSPDGRQLAFSSGNRRLTQIWAVDVESGELKSLVSEAQVSVNPIFGADGRYLYYIGISSEGSFTASFAIWRQPLNRATGESVGEAQKVTRLGLANIRQMTLAPSSDRLVYAALATVSGLFQLEIDDDGRAIGAATPWVRQGSRNSRPWFSMDGRQVAFDRWQMGRSLDIWIQDLEADAPPRQVTVDPAWDSQANWLADGTLAYFSEREGRRGIWHLDPETGEHTFLADIGLDADWARLSPDGKTIAFHSPQDSITLDVWLHDLTTKKTRRLTRDPELAGFPIWSPDGRTLAIEIQRGESTQVAVVSFPEGDVEVESGGVVPRQLTFDDGESWPYSWAPDNDRIAFAGRRGGFWNVFWVSSSSGEVVQLTQKQDLDGYLRYPAWSPKDGLIVFEEARTAGDLWQVELSSE